MESTRKTSVALPVEANDCEMFGGDILTKLNRGFQQWYRIGKGSQKPSRGEARYDSLNSEFYCIGGFG